MKVLLVHNTYQQPGGEDVVFEQERRLLTDAGHTVITYCRSNWEIDRLAGWAKISLSYRTIWNDAARREILGVLAQERPDIVHVHNTFIMISPSIFSACQEAGIPVVQSVHNYRLFCPVSTFFRDGKVCEACLERSLWQGVCHGCYHGSRSATAVVALMLAVNRSRHTWTQNVDGFIALTQFTRRKLIEGGIPEERIRVKPNFIHPDPGQGSGPRDYALFVGRLSPEKGASILLDAWSRLPEPIPLLIVGGGPERADLEQRVRRSGLATVQFRGQVSRAETIEAIQSARFLVFPSLWYENFPMTIGEAFACGTPVIASRLGAVEEIVDDSRTGIHFTPADAGELAAKAAWLWNHPAEVAKMGEEARREFEEKYTARSNYPILIDVYRQAMARRAGLGAAVLN